MTVSNSEVTGVVLPDEKEALIRLISGFLIEEQYRFQTLGNDCIELYLQGKHLTMRMLIYGHNRHLIVRVPGFIRNVELRRLDILLLLNQLMNDFFDIRFEMAEDGQSLSASSNHILEDGHLTKAQFIQCMTIVPFLIDESYPKIMQAIFGKSPAPEPGEKPEGGRKTPDTEEKSGAKKSKGQEAAELPDKDRKIN